LIERGANINHQNFDKATPLYLACRDGNDLIARLLLKNNANPKIEGYNGFTPFIAACVNGRENIVKILIGKVNEEKRDRDNNKGIHFSAYDGYLRVVKLLSWLGNDITSVGYNDQTPIQMAQNQKKTEIIKFLESEISKRSLLINHLI
jgi:ankyrin repeat protein